LSFIYFAPNAADLVILTIDARKITTAEKHVTNTIGSAYYRFFSMMNTYGTDIKPGIASAYSNVSLQPVDMAVTRANAARHQWFK
jgi:cyanate lyase